MTENTFTLPSLSKAWQIDQVARVIGFGFIAMFIPAFYGEFAVRNGMVNWEDSLQTFNTIKSDIGKFETGILAFMIVFLIDLVVIPAFYQLVKRQGPSLALLMASLRVVHVSIAAAGMVGMLMAHNLVSNTSITTSQELLGPITEQLLSFLKWHDLSFGMGLFFFSMHLVLLATLLFKTSWIPNWIAILVMASGVGFCLNCLAHFFFQEIPWIQNTILIILILPMTFAELTLGIWLLVRRRRLRGTVVL